MHYRDDRPRTPSPTAAPQTYLLDRGWHDGVRFIHSAKCARAAREVVPRIRYTARMRWGAGILGVTTTSASLVACGPPPLAPMQPVEAAGEPGARSSAVYGDVEPDPLLDPSTFEIDKVNEGDARRVAEERCGGPAVHIQSRVVTGTEAGKCEKGVLSSLLQDQQTTRSGHSGVVCSPSTDASQRTVHRYRCTKR